MSFSREHDLRGRVKRIALGVQGNGLPSHQALDKGTRVHLDSTGCCARVLYVGAGSTRAGDWLCQAWETAFIKAMGDSYSIRRDGQAVGIIHPH